MSPAVQAETTTNGVNGHIASGKKNFTGAKPGTKKKAKPAAKARSIPAATPAARTTPAPAIGKSSTALRIYFAAQFDRFGLGTSRQQWESFIGALNAAGPTICGFPAGQLSS